MGHYFKAQAAQTPTAMGSLLQSSAYGSAIPIIYGMTQSPLLAIWASNLRQGGTIKKFKQLKKGLISYVENIDFLLGHNPIRGVGQLVINGSLWPLGFNSIVLTNPGGLGYNESFAIVDPYAVAVIAVTYPLGTYSFTFDDFGSNGPVTLAGTYEVPCWNELETGPDPTNSSQFRYFPFCYRWAALPAYGVFPLGTTFYVDCAQGLSPVFKGYYSSAVLSKGAIPPLSANFAFFENELGSGTEYSTAGPPYNAQQIIYPQFAGVGSDQVDLGASGALPQILPEVIGKWGVYPSGDGDFIDMIEDIFKSGLAQASIGGSSGVAYTQMERGLSSYNLPGCVQRKTASNNLALPDITFDMPNTAGNFLIALGAGNSSPGTLTISDTDGNTWTPFFATGLNVQGWWAQAIGSLGNNTVTIGGFVAFNQQMSIFEIAGVDSFDSLAIGGHGASALTTTNAPGYPAYILSIALWNTTTAPGDPGLALWDPVLSSTNFSWDYVGHYASPSPFQVVIERTVFAPTYLETQIQPATGSGHVTACAMIAFKAAQPVNYPRPLGNFFDLPSADLTRAQCRAYGLIGSLSMNAQSAASDFLKSLYQAANAAPVFLGNKLYSIPYAEASTAGNGCQYPSPTGPGPIANLSDADGDFVGADGCPVRTTVSRIDLPNVLQMQIIDRSSQYNQITIQQPDAASIALYGVRKDDPVVHNEIQDPTVARSLLGIQARRNQYGGDTWEFTLNARWSLLSPMDLITLTDTLQNLSKIPVRITSYEEQDDGSFKATAEPFIYGMCTPSALPTSSPVSNPLNPNQSAGSVNLPLIFEPTPPLYPTLQGDQIWLVVSSPSPIYGGCQVYVSTDGGLSYVLAGNPIIGNATTGYTTLDWPAATDPDSTNDLPVDLTESLGVLSQYSTYAENNFEYPCYVEGETVGEEMNGIPIAAGNPLAEKMNAALIADIDTEEMGGTPILSFGAAAFNYELMSYAVANLTAANKYTLKATGAGNFLRRAIDLAPNNTGNGVDHALGSRFALLDPSGIGILKLPMPLQYIGQTLYFKCLSFNAFGSALQSLSDPAVIAYPYTPTGIPGAA